MCMTTISERTLSTRPIPAHGEASLRIIGMAAANMAASAAMLPVIALNFFQSMSLPPPVIARRCHAEREPHPRPCEPQTAPRPPTPVIARPFHCDRGARSNPTRRGEATQVFFLFSKLSLVRGRGTSAALKQKQHLGCFVAREGALLAMTGLFLPKLSSWEDCFIAGSNNAQEPANQTIPADRDRDPSTPDSSAQSA